MDRDTGSLRAADRSKFKLALRGAKEPPRDLPALAGVRSALEEALGLKFEGKKGEHFFRSTLEQTLFYGVFSAWVLWSKAASGV